MALCLLVLGTIEWRSVWLCDLDYSKVLTNNSLLLTHDFIQILMLPVRQNCKDNELWILLVPDFSHVTLAKWTNFKPKIWHTRSWSKKLLHKWNEVFFLLFLFFKENSFLKLHNVIWAKVFISKIEIFIFPYCLSLQSCDISVVYS